MTNEKFQIHINNASVLLEKEDEDAAINELNQALALVPNHAEAMLMRANAKRLRKFFAEALADYEKASELGADPLRTNLGWGETLVNKLDELGAVNKLEFDNALARLDVAINSNPDCAEAHYWRARCLLESNDLEAAIKAFQKSLDLNIDLSLFQSAKDFLKIASRRMNPSEFCPLDFVGDCPEYSDLFEAAHPNARRLLPESFFWTDDFGPIGGDNGVEIIQVFWPWRVKNPKGSVTKFMYDLLDYWLDRCVAEIDSIANSNVELCTGGSGEEMYRKDSVLANAYDDTVITLAYGQFMVDGYLDAGLRERALQAIERQTAASVLNYRSGGMEYPGGNPDYAEARRKIKEGLLRMPIGP